MNATLEGGGKNIAKAGEPVKVYKRGKTLVRIFDSAYAGKPPDEIQQLYKRLDRTCRQCADEIQAAGGGI